MQYEFPQVISRVFFAILIMSLVAVNAKPPHYQENTQGLNADQESTLNNVLDSGLRPWQLELFAQRMAELNQLSQMNNNLNGQEYGTFDRALRSGNEIKRQSRYRLCYFNPVSCFKK
ncbi:allatostatin [Dendroctonus ponderosae]